MGKESEKDASYTDLRSLQPDQRFPRVVVLIIIAEFCERFSFSGMRAFLTLYLRSKLGYSDESATEMYHIFSTFVYVFPIFGGILADNYLGKYRTILYMLFVYAAGNMLVAITAIPPLGLPGRLCTMIGLFLITVGTGGIKPCVTSFGGDQFKLPQQEKQLSAYFSVLFCVICIGSLIAKTVSPILRTDVHCFGDKDCYSLAFGAPVFVIFVSIAVFVSGKKQYLMKKPATNIMFDFVKCVSLGLKNALLKRNGEAHWLDSTRHKYDHRLIKDIKKTLSILLIFTVLPVFFALGDQMGSRWTLQATKMHGGFGFITVKPDQIQTIGPWFFLIMVPVMEKYVYPFLESHNILKNPLHKLTVGGVLAAVAFVASAVVEIYLKTTYPHLPQPGFSQLRIFNGNPCPISLYSTENINYTIPSLYFFEKKDIIVDGYKKLNLTLSGNCIEQREEIFLLNENTANSFYIEGYKLHNFVDKVDKSKSGLPVVRFLVSTKMNATAIMHIYDERRKEAMALTSGVSQQIEMFASIYSLMAGNDTIREQILMDSGGVYTIMIDENQIDYKSNIVITTEANSITMALLLPQYFIMALAEVLFAVTGYVFTFKEAPESMKAVMTAAYLLTEAVGNVIIIIITRLFTNYAQETQSFIYTGMMLVAVCALIYLSRGYKLRAPARECRSNSEVLYLQVKRTEDLLDS